MLRPMPTLRVTRFRLTNMKQWPTKIRHLLLGKEADKGLIFKLFIYLILLNTAYIYMRPLLYMITTMVKNSSDLLDPTVIWVPKSLYWGSLQQAWNGLAYPTALMKSFYIALIGALAHILSCSVAGYAFARLQFPFKKILFFCLLLTFIIPPQLLALPSYLLFNELKLINTVWPFLAPAFFGHGLKGALFVIIFRQFFSTQPKALEEAARIDGASAFRIFYRVMLPLAGPAITVVFLFSFVWHWNDTFMQSLFLGQLKKATVMPLSMGLESISEYLMAMRLQGSGDSALFDSLLDEPIKLAGSFLVFIPLIILFMYAQRWFIEGVERTGLVE